MASPNIFEEDEWSRDPIVITPTDDNLDKYTLKTTSNNAPILDHPVGMGDSSLPLYANPLTPPTPIVSDSPVPTNPGSPAFTRKNQTRKRKQPEWYSGMVEDKRHTALVEARRADTKRVLTYDDSVEAHTERIAKARMKNQSNKASLKDKHPDDNILDKWWSDK